MPVNYVSFYDALRFANWLHNGQGSAGHRDGRPTRCSAARDPSNGVTVTRNASATHLPDQRGRVVQGGVLRRGLDELLRLPVRGRITQTACAVPAGTTSQLRELRQCRRAISPTWEPTPARRARTAPSTRAGTSGSGTRPSSGSSRGLRGGSFDDSPGNLAASVRLDYNPTNENDSLGFRVAMIPEPSTALLLACRLGGARSSRAARS